MGEARPEVLSRSVLRAGGAAFNRSSEVRRLPAARQPGLSAAPAPETDPPPPATPPAPLPAFAATPPAAETPKRSASIADRRSPCSSNRAASELRVRALRVGSFWKISRQASSSAFASPKRRRRPSTTARFIRVLPISSAERRSSRLTSRMASPSWARQAPAWRLCLRPPGVTSPGKTPGWSLASPGETRRQAGASPSPKGAQESPSGAQS